MKKCKKIYLHCITSCVCTLAGLACLFSRSKPETLTEPGQSSVSQYISCIDTLDM